MALRNADSYLALERGDESEYLSVQAYKFYLEKNYQQAINTIKPCRKGMTSSLIWSAEYLYYLGLVYLELGIAISVCLSRSIHKKRDNFQ